MWELFYKVLTSQLRKTKQQIYILIRVTNSRVNGFQSYAIFLKMGGRPKISYVKSHHFKCLWKRWWLLEWWKLKLVISIQKKMAPAWRLRHTSKQEPFFLDWFYFSLVIIFFKVLKKHFAWWGFPYEILEQPIKFPTSKNRA